MIKSKVLAILLVQIYTFVAVLEHSIDIPGVLPVFVTVLVQIPQVVEQST